MNMCVLDVVAGKPELSFNYVVLFAVVFVAVGIGCIITVIRKSRS